MWESIVKFQWGWVEERFFGYKVDLLGIYLVRRNRMIHIDKIYGVMRHRSRFCLLKTKQVISADILGIPSV